VATYRVPTFNVTCNVFTGTATVAPPGPGVEPRVPALPCQLTYGTRVNVVSTGGTAAAGVLVQTMNLLVAKGSDLRGPQDVGNPDVIEVPAGTGRWYTVCFVDDIGRGFSNEHRTAGIFAIPHSWLSPYP
jgi:hypothetical protein